MLRGKVKFWHDEKGYAFIIEENTGKEYYTYKKYLVAGETRLFENSIVEFELEDKGSKGMHAINVKTIQI